MIYGYPKLEIEENIRFFMTLQNQKKQKVFLSIRKSPSFLIFRHSWQNLHPVHAFSGFNTPRYKPNSFISPIELAATHGWSISGATRFLRKYRAGYPSSELILKCLRDVSSAIMEDFINNLLKSSYHNLSSKLRKNIEKKGIFILDFHVDPYYGNEDNPDIKKGPLKHSTNKGYNFLTAEIHLDKFNFTIAVIHRPPGVKIYDLFIQLHKRVSRILKPNLIIMDGEFPTVRVLRKLVEMNIPCIARKIMTQRVKTSLAHYEKVEPHNWQRRWHRVDLRDT